MDESKSLEDANIDISHQELDTVEAKGDGTKSSCEESTNDGNTKDKVDKNKGKIDKKIKVRKRRNKKITTLTEDDWKISQDLEDYIRKHTQIVKKARKKIVCETTQVTVNEGENDDDDDDENKTLKDYVMETIKHKTDSDDIKTKPKNISEPSENVPVFKPEDSSTQIATQAPQLKLDANGNIILDEDSLFVKCPSVDEIAKSKTLIDTTDEITLNTPLLYNTKRSKAKRTCWSIKDTIKFYQVLSVVGADFSLMENFLHGKSRDGIKKKFKYEEKLHNDLVDKALNKTLDVENEKLFEHLLKGEKII